MRPRWIALVLLLALAPVAGAQGRRSRENDRYDDIFRKYSKRYFGAGFDWRLFKAQGMAESGLDPAATSHVGARGIMQLMPSTFQLIATARPEMQRIDDPEWNIAAGLMHDRYLWTLFRRQSTPERARFMFGAYNAGEGYIQRAQRLARGQQLDERTWAAIERVAPAVPRWRYRETLGYVRTIERNHRQLAVLRRGARSAPADSVLGPTPQQAGRPR